MEMFRDLIGQIGVFMICAQAVVHFRPKEVYGKYLRLLLSVMVLIQIISPIYGLLAGGTGESLDENVRSFQQEMEEAMGDAARRSVISQQQLEKTGLEMLREIGEQTGTEEAGGYVGKDVAEWGDIEMEGTDSEGDVRMDGTDKPEVAAVEIEIAPIRVGER